MTRRGGRRRLFASSCKVIITMDAQVYDRVYAVARQQRVSVPAVIREAIDASLLHKNIESSHPASTPVTVNPLP